MWESCERAIQQLYVRCNILNKQTSYLKCHSSVMFTKIGGFVVAVRVSILKSQKYVVGKFPLKSAVFVEQCKPSNKIVFRLIYLFLLLNPPRQSLLETPTFKLKNNYRLVFIYTRGVYINDAIFNSVPVRGSGEIVEIDEAKFGKRKCNCDRKRELDTWRCPT